MITHLVEKALGGDLAAHESLRVAVYDLIMAQARRRVPGERRGHTLQVTALANEIWKKLDELKMIPILAAQTTARAKALIGTIIRHFLVDYARRRIVRLRAEGGHEREFAGLEFEIDLTALAPGAGSISVSVFVDALEKLAKLDPEASEVFILRVFAGLSSRDIAELLNCSVRKVELAYKRAKILLAYELEGRKAG